MELIDEATKALVAYYKAILKSRAHNSDHAPGKAYAATRKEDCIVCKKLNKSQLHTTSILDVLIKFKDARSL